MIRKCTHCKKADTGDEGLKYCSKCMVKLRAWLDFKSKSEPLSTIPRKEDVNAGKYLVHNGVQKIYYGGSDDDAI